MKRAYGLLTGLILLAVSGVVAGIVWLYLTEYGQRRILGAAAALLAGTVLAGGAYLLVTRCCRRGVSALLVFAAVAALVLLPIGSVFYPGRVTHARFGLTIYGALPVPLLDVVARSHGGLWFRDKGHFISVEEVERLLASGTEIVVIGTGWQDAVRVDPEIHAIPAIELHVLRTPAAFDLFNELVTSGREVLLIAHTTC